jgi:RHS repeat-associated protein
MTSSITLRAKVLLLAAAAAFYPSFTQADIPPEDLCNCCCDEGLVCTCDQSFAVASSINILHGSVEDDYPILSPTSTSPGSLRLELAYSSQHASSEFMVAANTSLGFGWAHNYGTFLFLQQAEMYRRDGRGRIVKFNRQPGTSPVLYKPTAGSFETMIRNTNGSFTIKYPNGTVEQFTNFAGCPYFFMSPIYQMTERVDRNGNTTTLAYDASGRLSTVTDPYGRILTFAYDANNRIQTITDPLGRVTQFAYSPFGAAPLRITDPLGYAVQYEYDSQYRVTTKIHKNGDVFLCTYGDGVLSAEYLNPNGTPTFLGSVANNNNWALNVALLAEQLKTAYLPSSVIRLDALSNSWVYTYDQNAYPVSIVPPGQTNGRLLAYDPATLRPSADTDANGNTTYRQYDAMGNLLAVTDCLGQVTSYTYETNFNRVTSITDPNNFLTTNLYDVDGNWIMEIDPMGFTREWTYDYHGNVLTETDKNGNITRHFYDEFGNCTNTTDALGNVTSFTYDAVGNLLSSTDANLHTTTNAYDALDRVISVTTGLSDPPSPPPPLGTMLVALNASTPPAGGFLLEWDDSSGMVLTTASNLAGPFEDVLVDGAPVTTSPFQVPGPFTNACEFYRLRSDAGWFPQTGGLQPNPLSNASAPSVTLYTYDAEGNRTSVTDANGHTTWYAYDERNRLTYTTNALGCVTAYTYDAAGNEISETDANGHTTWYAYDAQNRPAYTTNALGYVTAFAYDMVGNLTAITDANRDTTTFTYDSLNRHTAITNALGYVTQYEYDAPTGGGGCGCGAGTKGTSRVTKQTDANGKVTYFKYDPLGRRLRIIRKQGDTADVIGANDAVTTYTYDPNGNRLAMTDPNNITNSFGYDALNRQIASTNGAGDVTLTTYDPAGNLLVTTAPNGNSTTNTYDTLNRLIQVDDAMGRAGSCSYDAVGNRLSQTDGNTNTTQYAYDALNRLVTTTDPMGSSSTKVYDPVGNLVQSIDRNGNSTLHAYDSLNRQTITVDALGGVTTRIYDALGNLLAITDANNHTTSYEYDALNRKVSENYADSPADTRTYTYDPVGNLTSRTDQKGNTTLYLYSDFYYLTNRVYASDPADRFTYDLAGRMLTASKTNWLATNDWVVTFTYDGANRVIQTVQNGQTISYTYNIPGRTRTLTYPGGRVITEHTDFRARLAEIDDPGSPPPIVLYTYDPGNRVLNRAYRNGAVAAYTYNANNWLTNLNHTVGATLIAGFAYAYDNEGNKAYQMNQAAPSASEGYSYDALYRLTNFDVGALSGGVIPSPSIAETWNLDAVGNWNTFISNSVTQTRAHNAVNELVAINGSPLTYDANGNLQQDTTYTYAYDEENRLTQVTRNSDSAVVGQYQYDALSRRVQKVANPAGVPGTTRYFHDGARIIEEQNALGATQATYVYGNYVDEVLTMDRAAQTYYYHQNALWSVEAITDSTANPAERYAYDVYGFVTVTDGTSTPVPVNAWGTPHSAIGNPYVFTGRQLDEEAGLYCYRARYYDPSKGRFLQRDPREYKDGMNLYQYVRSMPTRMADPFGLQTFHVKCGQVVITHNVQTARFTFVFTPDKPPTCCCTKYGVIQHVCKADGAGGLACGYDNFPSHTALGTQKYNSDPNLPIQPINPGDPGYTGNPWYGGGGPNGQPNPGTKENPQPQSGIGDQPGGNETFITQVVCVTRGQQPGLRPVAMGEVLFSWQWSPNAAGNQIPPPNAAPPAPPAPAPNPAPPRAP